MKKTRSDIKPDEKNAVSHRGKALRLLAEHIMKNIPEENDA